MKQYKNNRTILYLFKDKAPNTKNSLKKLMTNYNNLINNIIKMINKIKSIQSKRRFIKMKFKTLTNNCN